MIYSLKCLRPECGLPQRVRGLCLKDYTAAKRLVEERKTTWAKLEAQGKCKTAKPFGRQPSAGRKWFLDPQN